MEVSSAKRSSVSTSMTIELRLSIRVMTVKSVRTKLELNKQAAFMLSNFLKLFFVFILFTFAFLSLFLLRQVKKR